MAHGVVTHRIKVIGFSWQDDCCCGTCSIMSANSKTQRGCKQFSFNSKKEALANAELPHPVDRPDSRSTTWSPQPKSLRPSFNAAMNQNFGDVLSFKQRKRNEARRLAVRSRAQRERASASPPIRTTMRDHNSVDENPHSVIPESITVFSTMAYWNCFYGLYSQKFCRAPFTHCCVYHPCCNVSC